MMNPGETARKRGRITFEEMRQIFSAASASCRFEPHGWTENEYFEEENYRDFVDVHRDMHKAEALMIRRLRDELGKCTHIAHVGDHPELAQLCHALQDTLNNWLRIRRAPPAASP